MPDHDDAPRRQDRTEAAHQAKPVHSRAVRLGLSIGGGALSLAALQQPALAGACGDGVVLEGPGQAAVISATGAVNCIVIGDALLSLTGQIVPLVPLGAPTGLTTYTYDSAGELPSEVDSVGRTTLSYDFAGQPTRYTDDLGRLTTYTYQYGAGRGELTQVATPDGNTTTFEYNPGLHEVTQDTSPSSELTTYTYDAGVGTLTENMSGRITTFTYSSGLLQSETDPLGRTTTYNYDDGQLMTIDGPDGITTYTYDAGELSQVTDPGGMITTLVYDASDRLISDTGNSDSVTSFAYAGSIPEPSSMALLVSGIAGWLGLRRRR